MDFTRVLPVELSRSIFLNIWDETLSLGISGFIRCCLVSKQWHDFCLNSVTMLEIRKNSQSIMSCLEKFTNLHQLEINEFHPSFHKSLLLLNNLTYLEISLVTWNSIDEMQQFSASINRLKTLKEFTFRFEIGFHIRDVYELNFEPLIKLDSFSIESKIQKYPLDMLKLKYPSTLTQLEHRFFNIININTETMDLDFDNNEVYKLLNDTNVTCLVNLKTLSIKTMEDISFLSCFPNLSRLALFTLCLDETTKQCNDKLSIRELWIGKFSVAIPKLNIHHAFENLVNFHCPIIESGTSLDLRKLVCLKNFENGQSICGFIFPHQIYYIRIPKASQIENPQELSNLRILNSNLDTGASLLFSPIEHLHIQCRKDINSNVLLPHVENYKYPKSITCLYISWFVPPTIDINLDNLLDWNHLKTEDLKIVKLYLYIKNNKEQHIIKNPDFDKDYPFVKVYTFK